MNNLYCVTQWYDDGDEKWAAHEGFVRAGDEGEAKRILFEDDPEEVRRQGWLDSTVLMTGWATGESMGQKGILGFV